MHRTHHRTLTNLPQRPRRPRRPRRPGRPRRLPQLRRLRRRDERGDVPGWVLVTVMTITIGMAIWGVAQPQLVGILQSALDSVR